MMDDQDKQVLTAKTPEAEPEPQPEAQPEPQPEAQPEPVSPPAPTVKRNRALWVVIGVLGLCLALCACAVIGAGAAFGLARVRSGLSLHARPSVEVGPPARVRPPEDVWPPLGCEQGGCLRSGIGALIVEVTEGGPAGRAGLQVGDTIVAVDGQALDHEHDLADLIAGYKPGDEVTLQVEGPHGVSRTVKVKLGEHPDQGGAPYLGVRYMPLPGMMDEGGQFGPFGQREFNFDPRGPGGGGLDERLHRFFGELPFEGGAIIVQVIEGSPAVGAGLQTGDVITAVNGAPVDGPEALSATVAGLKPGDEIALTVYRAGNEGKLEIEVTLGEHPGDKAKAYLGVHLGGFTHMERAPEGDQGLPRFRFFGTPGQPQSEQPGQPQSGQSWEELLRKFEFQWPPEGKDQGPSGLFGETL